MLAVTTFGQGEEVVAAIWTGAAGYLLKAPPRRGSAKRVRAVAVGESMLQPSGTAKLMAEFPGSLQALGGARCSLSLQPDKHRMQGRGLRVPRGAFDGQTLIDAFDKLLCQNHTLTA